MNNNYIEQKKNTHLYFQLGENKYAISTTNVLEIMKLPALDYPQKLPNNIIGLLKYNNFVINIIDIRFYLDIEVKPYNTDNELLIVKTDEVIYGIITDKIIGILPFDTTFVDQIPFTDNKTIIDSIYKYQDDTIFITNVYAIENLLKQHNNKLPEVDIPSLFPQDQASKSLLMERTSNIADKATLRLATSEYHAKNKYISFNLNKDYYCITLDSVIEVVKDSLITKVPGTPDFIEGIINLRGDYITVINLKKFLELPNENISDKKPVIIIECNDLKLAFLIDKINELFDYQETVAVGNADSYYVSEFLYENNLYTIINVNKITSDKKIVITDI